MSLGNKKEACIVKINLTEMDSEMRSPKITSLLDSGFNISSCVPVSDEGLPTMLVVFEKKIEHTSIVNHMVVALLILLVAINYYEVFN